LIKRKEKREKRKKKREKRKKKKEKRKNNISGSARVLVDPLILFRHAVGWSFLRQPFR
jgi:hypothetical protein